MNQDYIWEICMYHQIHTSTLESPLPSHPPAMIEQNESNVLAKSGVLTERATF